MDRRQAEALDRWLTTDPRDTRDVCPECGECEMVDTDCDHMAWECHVTSPTTGDTTIRVCRTEYEHLYHEEEPDYILMCSCDNEFMTTGDSYMDPYCEVHGR